MYKRKKRFQFSPLVLILLLVLGLSVGTILAKYIFRQDMSSTVTFTARLADNVLLQEHEAVRNADGSYKLNGNLLPTESKHGNTYDLLPGLDVPKDPFVTVVNKTPIGAYLFIEVQSTLNDAIYFEIDDTKWTKLSITGKDIYVYKDADNPDGLVLTNANCPTEAIPILKDNKITVSQDLLENNTAEDDILTFSAYLYEVHDNKNPTDIFNEHPVT